VQVYLKLGPARVVIPVHISHIQYKALARVVLNMVDTIPCIGAPQTVCSSELLYTLLSTAVFTSGMC
jgi:hypothetical protein